MLLNPAKNTKSNSNNNTIHYIEKPAPPLKPKSQHIRHPNINSGRSNSPEKLKIQKTSIKTQRNSIKLHFTDILNKKAGFKAPSPPANNSSRHHFQHSNVSFKATANIGADSKSKSVKNANSFTTNLLKNSGNSVNSKSKQMQNFSLQTDRKELRDFSNDQIGGEQTARTGSQLSVSRNQHSSLMKAKLNCAINKVLGASSSTVNNSLVQQKGDKVSSISSGGVFKKKLQGEKSGNLQIGQIKKVLEQGVGVVGKKSFANANTSSQKKSNLIGELGGIYHQNFVRDSSSFASTARSNRSAFTPNDLCVKKQHFNFEHINTEGALGGVGGKGRREASLENDKVSNNFYQNKND